MARQSILSYFPRHLTPRDVQRDPLLALEEHWDRANVFVVNLPVSSGKSAIAMTLINWQRHGKVITPTKLLVNQYQDEYPYIHVMRGKNEYYCQSLGKKLSERTKKEGDLCHTRLNCSGCEKYKKDLYQSQNSPFVLSNYFVYLAYGLTSSAETLIVDEAHNLISTLQEMHAKKIWHKDLQYPPGLETREQIRDFFNNIPKDYYSNLFKRGHGKKKRGVANPIEFKLYDKIQKFKTELNSERPKYMFEMGTDKYRGEELDCIKMLPLDIRTEPEILWSSTKKMVLLSATLSRKDIEQLGIADKKIQYIEADSPIRAELRPVIVPDASLICL